MAESGAKSDFSTEISALLKEREMTIPALAKKLGIDRTHLFRLVKGEKSPSAELCERVAHALDVPADSFAKYREAALIKEIRGRPELRERLYKQLKKRR